MLVVNLDRGATGATLVDDLKASGGINVETTWENQPLTRALAEQLIVDQKRSIAIVIPEDFSDALQKVAFDQKPRHRRRSNSSSIRPRPNRCWVP